MSKSDFDQPLTADNEVHWTLRPGAVVTGRVITKSDGHPLAGIILRFGSVQNGRAYYGESLDSEAVTDAEGRFRLASLPDGKTIFRIDSMDFAPCEKEVAVQLGKPVEVDFQLDAGKSITGRVTDPDGKPIRVAMVALPVHGGKVFDDQARTDAEGRFKIPHVPDGRITASIRATGYTGQSRLPMPESQHYDVSLKPVGKLSAQVRLAETGKPPATLEIQSGQGFGDFAPADTSFQNSGFLSTYDPATGTLVYIQDEYSTGPIFLRLRAPWHKAVVVQAQPESAHAPPLEIVLQPAAGIRGRVVAADTGQAMAGVTVVAVSEQESLTILDLEGLDSIPESLRWSSGVRVDSAFDGSFELPEDAIGKCSGIALVKKGHGVVYIPSAQALIADGHLELPMPTPGRLEGRVTVGGKIAANQQVNVEWIPPNGSRYAQGFPVNVEGTILTDRTGRFQLGGLSAGRYRIARTKASPNWAGYSLDAHEVIVLPGQTVEHDVVRPVGRTITGQTLDGAEKPLGDCGVDVRRRDGKNRECFDTQQSGPDGTFRFDNLPAAELELSTRHFAVLNGGSAVYVNEVDYFGGATLKADTTTVVIHMWAAPDAELAGGPTSPRKLTGRVMADRGKTPASGMKITVWSDNGYRREAIADAEGRFAIRVVPGFYSMRLEGTPQFATINSEELTSVEVPEQSDPQPFDLVACRAVAIEGIVVDVAGKPVPDAWIGATISRARKGRCPRPLHVDRRAVGSELHS